MCSSRYRIRCGIHFWGDERGGGGVHVNGARNDKCNVYISIVYNSRNCNFLLLSNAWYLYLTKLQVIQFT